MKSPKTKKGLATKTKMIETAANLIHTNGIAATTVNDILSHSNTGKSQFSHYFGNKDELLVAVIDHQFRRMMKSRKEIIENINSIEEFSNFFDYLAERQKDFLENNSATCPICQIASENPGHNDRIRGKLEEILTEEKQWIYRKLTELQDNGKIRSEINCDEITDFIFSCSYGGFIMGKTKQSTLPLRRSLGHALKYLETIVH